MGQRLNGRTDIDFVIHGGDQSDFGGTIKFDESLLQGGGYTLEAEPYND